MPVKPELHLVKTRDIANPTYYVTALENEYVDYAFHEERAKQFKGVWRQQVFSQSSDHPLDVEIGTGNGFFFAHRAASEPSRGLVGIEIKFKPLIQSIRRALKAGLSNARIMRFHAGFLDMVFEPQEIDHVFIHHPDPWTKRRKEKRRLMHKDFLARLYTLQKPDRFLEFKTDSREYFFWAVEQFKDSPYKVERYTEDLHHSEWAGENFITHFESIYLQKGQPIYYLRARKEKAPAH